jgi:hypothetical protein
MICLSSSETRCGSSYSPSASHPFSNSICNGPIPNIQSQPLSRSDIVGIRASSFDEDDSSDAAETQECSSQNNVDSNLNIPSSTNEEFLLSFSINFTLWFTPYNWNANNTEHLATTQLNSQTSTIHHAKRSKRSPKMRNQNKKLLILDDSKDDENTINEDIPLNHTESSSNSGSNKRKYRC